MNINYWNHIESMAVVMEPSKYSQKTSCHFLTSLTLGQLYIYIYLSLIILRSFLIINQPQPYEICWDLNQFWDSAITLLLIQHTNGKFPSYR